jgi:hypothetical protein
MLIIFLDIKGVVHKQFVLAGQMVNFTYCCDIVWRLSKYVRRLDTELLRKMNWLLHHDNEHFFIRDIFIKYIMALVSHSLYSPDLALASFFLFHD